MVLQEPQQRVTDYAIELVICTPRRNYKAKVKVVSFYWCLETPTVCQFRSTAISLTHGASDPGEVHVLTYGTENSDYTTAAPAPFKITRFIKRIIDWTPVARDNEVPVTLKVFT